MNTRSAIIYFLALAVVAVTAACWVGSEAPAGEGAVPESQVRLHLEQVYGADTAPADAIIGAIGGSALGPRGNIYVLDARQSRLVAFNGNGSVAWVAGQRGDGPGDFSSAGPVAFDGVSTLHVSNHRGTSVDSWNSDGRYVGRHSVETVIDRSTARIAGFIEPSYLVLVSRLRERPGNAVFVVDVGNDDWELVSQFEVDAGPEELPEYTSLFAVPPVIVVNDSILVGNYGIYAAKVYDSAGTLLRVFSRELDTLAMPRMVNTPLGDGRFHSRGFTLGGLVPPIPLEDGYWMTQVSWPVTDIGERARQWLADPSTEFEPAQMMNAVDVFDSSGDLVSSVVTEGGQPSEGLVSAFGADMRLYTIARDPFPQVRRYRVEIER